MISMQMNIGGLERFVKSVDQAAIGDVTDAVRFIARKLLIKILERMPVKTGRARAGWKQAGVALGVAVPDAIVGASQAGDSRFQERWEGMKFVVEMANGVPYVLHLEYGLSPQAPLGMVRVSILEVVMDSNLGRDIEDRLKQSWAALSVSERYQQHVAEFNQMVA